MKMKMHFIEVMERCNIKKVESIIENTEQIDGKDGALQLIMRKKEIILMGIKQHFQQMINKSQQNEVDIKQSNHVTNSLDNSIPKTAHYTKLMEEIIHRQKTELKEMKERHELQVRNLMATIEESKQVIKNMN